MARVNLTPREIESGVFSPGIQESDRIPDEVCDGAYDGTAGVHSNRKGAICHVAGGIQLGHFETLRHCALCAEYHDKSRQEK